MQNRHLLELVRHRDPVTMQPGATAQEACGRMRHHRVGCVVVTDAQDRPIGIFTGRDAVRLGAEGRHAGATRLEDAMTRDPQCLGPGATALDALRLMQDGGFRHIPLVQDGRCVGVVSRGDFRALEHRRLDEETGLWERI
jgi:CBS domain-containing protein